MKQTLKGNCGKGTRVRYHIVKEKLHSPEIGQYCTFGVQVLRKNKNKWETADTVSDISVNRRMVAAFVKRCNQTKLDPIHLRDAATDLVSL